MSVIYSLFSSVSFTIFRAWHWCSTEVDASASAGQCSTTSGQSYNSFSHKLESIRCWCLCLWTSKYFCKFIARVVQARPKRVRYAHITDDGMNFTKWWSSKSIINVWLFKAELRYIQPHMQIQMHINTYTYAYDYTPVYIRMHTYTYLYIGVHTNTYM